jgi:hypothetical protein
MCIIVYYYLIYICELFLGDGGGGAQFSSLPQAS